MRSLVVLRRILFAAALCTPCCALAQHSDYAREKRWADEVVPGIVVGEAVWLKGKAPQKFLGLYAEAKGARAAVVLVHGLGVQPDHGVIGALRVRLADAGYTTLSIQMPILAADAPASRYSALFEDAAGRIAAAGAWLRAKGYRRIALASHSMGSRMANRYFVIDPKAPFFAWVAISISSGDFERFGRPKFRIFDIYAEKDFDAVLRGAAGREQFLRRAHGAKQAMVYGADHTFARKEGELASLIRLLLDDALK